MIRTYMISKPVLLTVKDQVLFCMYHYNYFEKQTYLCDFQCNLKRLLRSINDLVIRTKMNFTFLFTHYFDSQFRITFVTNIHTNPD